MDDKIGKAGLRDNFDTNVISALRRAERTPKVAAWMAAIAEGSLYISVITLGEIERGICLQEKHNPDFAADRRAWLERTIKVFSDRVLAFKAEDALIWGTLAARFGQSGADLMIEAQALSRDATVVTRNRSDFARTGARTVDPFWRPPWLSVLFKPYIGPRNRVVDH